MLKITESGLLLHCSGHNNVGGMSGPVEDWNAALKFFGAYPKEASLRVWWNFKMEGVSEQRSVILFETAWPITDPNARLTLSRFLSSRGIVVQAPQPAPPQP